MSKRKRERRRPATDAHPETSSQKRTTCQYNRYTHRQLTGPKRKAVLADLPGNLPDALKRSVAKSVARLERLAADGNDVPGIEMDYRDTDGGISTFIYIPGTVADKMAEDLLAAMLLFEHREEARA